MKRSIALILSVAAASFGFIGCAAVMSNLPAVIAYVQDGQIVLDTIVRFVDAFFVTRPNADLQAKVDRAVARARSALDLALRAASGTGKINQADIDGAFNDFKVAYLDLMALVGPLGVKTGSALAAAPGGGLVVPEPMVLVRK